MKMIEATRQYKNMFYEHGWTTPEAAEREKGNHAHGDAPSAYERLSKYFEDNRLKIDILFIDSWHTYENAMLDWRYYRPLLNSPALVICDDIQEGGGPESPISGMLDFWDKLPEPKFLNENLHPGTNMGFLKT
jgi:predicted O-methyltransferase YrrM